MSNESVSINENDGGVEERRETRSLEHSQRLTRGPTSDSSKDNFESVKNVTKGSGNPNVPHNELLAHLLPREVRDAKEGGMFHTVNQTGNPGTMLQQAHDASNDTLNDTTPLESIGLPLQKFGSTEFGLSSNMENNQDEFIDLNQYIENYKLSAVSPLSNATSTLNSSQGTPPNKEKTPKEQEYITKPKILDPLGSVPDGRILNSMFQMSDMSVNQEDGESKKNGNGKRGADSPAMLDEKRSTWLHQNKHKVTYGSLILLILLIISCFIPVVVRLYNGTQETVNNYFKSLNQDERLRMFKSLVNDYGLLRNLNGNKSYEGISRIPRKETKGSDLAGFNTINGINPKYKDDPEVVSLMSGKGFFGTVFFGLGYAPRDAMEPACGATKRDILLDLTLISRVTTRIRNYGMQCNQSSLILDSIQDLQLNMTLAMGVWIGSNKTTNAQQIDWMKDILRKYPRNVFECIFIGNEVLFREELTSQDLSEYIDDAKSFTKEIGYDDLPIGTSEIGSLIDKTLLKSCDIIGANVHPFFSGGDVGTASQWAFDFVKYQIEPLNEDSNTEIIITEVGWPYKGGEYEAAVADPKSFQTFLNDWVCDAYDNEYGWYYFEAFDEPWKRIFYEDGNKWETEWGVFTKYRNHKKHISLPNC